MCEYRGIKEESHCLHVLKENGTVSLSFSLLFSRCIFEVIENKGNSINFFFVQGFPVIFSWCFCHVRKTFSSVLHADKRTNCYVLFKESCVFPVITILLCIFY